MASGRYTLNIKEEDLQPEEPVVLTEEEKRANWLHYHKWQIIGLAILVGIVALFIHDMVTKVDPDYNVAVVTVAPLSDETVQSLGRALEAYLPDVDGDGHIYVNVVHYSVDYEDQALHQQQDAQIRMAGELRLTTDMTTGTSTIFITDNLRGIQQSTELFSLLDNPYSDPSPEEALQYDQIGYNWADSPLLCALPLEGQVFNPHNGELQDAQAFFATCQVALRVPFDLSDDEAAAAFANCVALMDQVRGIA